MTQKYIDSVEWDFESAPDQAYRSSGTSPIGYPPADRNRMIWEVHQTPGPKRIRFSLKQDGSATKKRVRRGTICPF